MYDPDAGELLPDGSRIQITTAGELADYLAEHPPDYSCGCEDPKPFNLCCPVRLTYPAYAVTRNRKGRRDGTRSQ